MLHATIRRALPALMMVGLLAACGAPATNGGAGTASAGASSAAGATTAGSANTAGTGGELTIYSGRNENLVGPLLEQYEQETGTQLNVKYGDTAELAATILEEGANSPADVFLAQDAGALGALADEDRLQALPDAILNKVDARFRSPEGEWVGVSGRARVVVYDSQTITETDLPDTIFGFTDPKWKGKLGWVPTNGSFQAFVTALRVLEGEERAREWLEGIKANEPKVYDNNTAVVQAVGAGEIQAGFVNHYYLLRQLKERGNSFGARNYYLKNGDPGALVNVAGTGILSTAKHKPAAEQFVQFLLSDVAQRYFAEQTYEYPVVPSIPLDPELPALDEIQSPQLDLSKINDLKGTLQLLQDLGIL
ncbi:MAG: iron ABC transporter substrate-binding protein [Chloroflexi bacterium]|nr:MAG: iron ABC transporter substrate-binding protein [Chloroflexota bacterium]